MGVLLLLDAVSSHGDNSADVNLRGSDTPALGAVVDLRGSLEVPPNNGPLDHPGPYEEIPEVPQASSPTHLRQTANSSVESSFCGVHKTGFWCEGLTRVRCCKLEGGGLYAQCGSTANSSACGWRGDTHLDAENSTNVTLDSAWWPWYGGDERRRRGGSWNGGGSGGWHIHAGWHTSSYCESHHVGRFCSSHRIIHCCNDYGHFVECNTQYHHSSWWC